jgi:hypothetical protein
MNKVNNLFIRLQKMLLSEEVREWSERVIIFIAIFGFLLHLLLILLAHLSLLDFGTHPLLKDYNSAIYTPFSFILIYEVYLLVYHLPLSISNYIAKQYEIVTLIIIRRIFKDISELKLTLNWFENKADLQFSLDIITTFLLFFLIFLFYKLVPKRNSRSQFDSPSLKIQRFVNIKRIISISLVPVVAGLAIYSFVEWLLGTLGSAGFVGRVPLLKNVFFDDFFTLLILVDVLLLLISFFGTEDFSKVIRNSGFVISTILIKLSFSTGGIMNVSLVLLGVLFGVGILWVHNQYEKLDLPREF